MTTATPESREHPVCAALPSVRGIVLGENRRGGAFDLTALRAWLRLNAEKFLARKIDLREPNATAARVIPLLEEAAQLDVRLSLRTTPRTDLAVLPELHAAGLFDVLLELSELDTEALNAWADRCASLSLPLRVRLDARALQRPASAEATLAMARAAHVTVALDNPFAPPLGPPPPLENIVALAEALALQGADVHVADVPFCRLPASLWHAVTHEAQRLAGHQHYRAEAWDFALKLAPLSPRRAHQAVEIALGQGESFHNLVDNAVLPWILEKPRWFFWLWFAHKLTRRLPLRRPRPKPLPEGEAHWERLLADREAERRRRLGPLCAGCRLHRICDHPGVTFRNLYPRATLTPVPGEPIIDPLAFRNPDTTWYDMIDEERRHQPALLRDLADAARSRIAQEPPSREIAAENYEIQDHATHRMPASIRWFSFSTAEMRSTVLARVSPPFTLSLTFGGGIAERIGFSFGRGARIMCPMTAYRHQLTIHADAGGRFVLLRDGIAVPPSSFHDADRVPERLAGVVDPRIAMINADGQIVTQTVLLWEGAPRADARPASHSVVIVCTRFSRRLQAALLALAGRQGAGEAALEVIVAYVPGLDATDDVLDSLEAVHTHLSIVRIPFARDKARSKGFMINECTALASGAWITLLDADILLPPDYFARLDALPADAAYAAPEGRHMLNPETTARVLLGEISPRDHYNELRQQSGEYRHRESEGVPPGFCQSLRRHVFEALRYEELDHFEGSDWWFSKRVMEMFGPVVRLDGMSVLHLDHGGSQWYGTGKQR